MRNDFHERRERRRERLEELANKNQAASKAGFDAAFGEIEYIPPGQPILVGHHSERGHRRALERHDNKMRAAFAAEKKAAYYRDRLASMDNDRVISSDDPDAIEKLLARLEDLEAYQQLMKDANKIIRSKKLSDAEKVTRLQDDLGFSEARAMKRMSPNCFGALGFDGYELTNNGANIRRIRERIETLERRFGQESTEVEINDVKILKNVEGNRVQVFFPGKPDADVRTKLKRAGFRWAPTEGAWQKNLSDWAFQQAKDIVEKL